MRLSKTCEISSVSVEYNTLAVVSCELIIMSSNSESENEEICGKKRTRNVKLWKVNKRKFARQCGESYVSTSGKIVTEKKPGPPCT